VINWLHIVVTCRVG